MCVSLGDSKCAQRAPLYNGPAAGGRHLAKPDLSDIQRSRIEHVQVPALKSKVFSTLDLPHPKSVSMGASRLLHGRCRTDSK